ncbi:MAG TPA: SPOR domain-containing protein [Bacteroidota bacterium]|nr:SPOR domain-containing protein [Bacteroidota bacterium]
MVGIAAGCGSSAGPTRDPSSQHNLREFLAKYEPGFNPSDFDPDISTLEQQEAQRHNALTYAEVAAPAVPETIPGFRVQVLFTQEIDEASQVRDTLSTLLPNEWVYLVYDVPYYKVRVGNYADRTAAGPALKHLVALGYKDAWIVPDNIIKNPPPRFPEEFIPPENPFDKRH